jgi:hypothetical protein
MAETYIFRDEHRPALLYGAYKLIATWSVSVDQVPKAGQDQAADFFVAGERFSLTPADIHSTYPPEGGRGSYEDCLPHIALIRDTLPWERKANQENAPWLALLVLHEDEASKYKLSSIEVKNYVSKTGIAFNPEPGQSDSDLLQVIELPRDLTELLLPDAGGLSTLCHVRARGDGAADESVAVVVSRRLPGRGRNTVHLVSLEHRYVGTAFNLGEQPTITLISLKSWSFTCEEAGHPESESLEKIFSNFSSLKKASWLRLPPEVGKNAQAHTSAGFVPVPHRFRTGESGVSWYSGPLIPAIRASEPKDKDALKLPAKFADELLWYETNLGMLTITYAAAWELGRMLVMQNRRIQTSLQSWRRKQIRHAQAMAAAEDSQCKHLPQIQRACHCAPEPPAELTAWIDGLRALQGVPFKYLVPDERMLPTESIRFFAVDSQWIDALLDGALSLARMPTEHKQCCQDAEKALIASSKSHTITGFMMRSAAVAGWPGLNVAATGVNEQILTSVRHEQLSPSILLCLFEGRITSLSIQQSPETLHLSIEGHTHDSAIWKTKTKIWKDEAKRILDIGALNNAAGSDFANQMLHRYQKLQASVTWD